MVNACLISFFILIGIELMQLKLFFASFIMYQRSIIKLFLVRIMVADSGKIVEGIFMSLCVRLKRKLFFSMIRTFTILFVSFDFIVKR